MTLAIDDDLKDRMDEYPEINWSDIARQSTEPKLDALELMDRLADGIDLSQEDIDDLAAEINRRATERVMEISLDETNDSNLSTSKKSHLLTGSVSWLESTYDRE